MKAINKATTDQAERLFQIQIQAVVLGCAPYYPSEIIGVWNIGRSVAGMAKVIATGNIYSVHEADVIVGFIEILPSEIPGLFIDPNYHGKGYGSELLRFAIEKIKKRPIMIQSTLNAVSFYSRHGFQKIATESVRRHDRDIYVVKMKYV